MTDKDMQEVAARLGLGATGDHPHGKLTPDDEGGLRFGVTHKGDTVIVSFGKPVAWFGLKSADVREFVKLLLKHADAVDGKEGQP